MSHMTAQRPRRSPPAYYKWRPAADFADENIGMAVSEDSAIALTSDGGQTWVDITPNVGEALRGVRLQGQTGLVFGSQRLFRVKGMKQFRPACYSIGEIQQNAAISSHSLLIHDRRRRHVLERRPSAVEDDHLFTVFTPRLPAGDHLAEFRMRVRPRHQSLLQGELQVADGCALVKIINDDLAGGDQARIQLLLLLVVRADRGDECAGPNIRLV